MIVGGKDYKTFVMVIDLSHERLGIIVMTNTYTLRKDLILEKNNYCKKETIIY